jgi:hypothetical protein
VLSCIEVKIQYAAGEIGKTGEISSWQAIEHQFVKVSYFTIFMVIITSGTEMSQQIDIYNRTGVLQVLYK